MAKIGKLVVLCLILSAATASQRTAAHSPRIICTPPTLKILKMVQPTLPPDANPSDFVGGGTLIEVEIDKAGLPSRIEVLKGNPVAANAVVKAVKQWRWKPLRLNGVAVETVARIAINFEVR